MQRTVPPRMTQCFTPQKSGIRNVVKGEGWNAPHAVKRGHHVGCKSGGGSWRSFVFCDGFIGRWRKWPSFQGISGTLRAASFCVITSSGYKSCKPWNGIQRHSGRLKGKRPETEMCCCLHLKRLWLDRWGDNGLSNQLVVIWIAYGIYCVRCDIHVQMFSCMIQ